jgi:hypothetical protein
VSLYAAWTSWWLTTCMRMIMCRNVK